MYHRLQHQVLHDTQYPSNLQCPLNLHYMSQVPKRKKKSTDLD